MKRFIGSTFLFLSFGLYVACTSSSNPSIVATGTDTISATSCESVSFQTQIQPLMSEKCLTCHGSNSRDGDFTTYDNVKREINEIRMHALIIKNMPPSTAPQLTPEESEQLKCWISNSAEDN